MTNTAKPPLFRWIDALSFGLPALVGTGAFIVALLNGRNAHVPAGAWSLFGFVVCVFWAGYILLLWWRHKHLSRIRYVTKQGITVIAGGGVVPPLSELEAEIDRTMDLWSYVPGAHDRLVGKVVDGTALWVMPFPFDLGTGGPKFAGFAKPFTKQIAVGMDGRLLPGTALGHELGHIIAEEIFGDGSEARLKALAKEHGIPY